MKDLRTFLRTVKELGPEYYVEVQKPMDIDLEVNTLQQKLSSIGRKPVIFCQQMKGVKIPYVTDLFGSRELLGLALDITPEMLTKIGKAELLREFRRRVATPIPVECVPSSDSPVKDIILRDKDIDLGILPIPQNYPGDSGKYICIGGCICTDATTSIPNMGVYRHEVKAKDKLGCLINPTNHGAYIGRRRAELGLKMDVAIAIGHHPAVIMAACHTGSLEMNELEIAGALLGEPLRVTKAETVDVPVPADAEIIIEGVIDPAKMITDGPFAEFTGYYGNVAKCYLINVTCITMRRDAIFHGLDPNHIEHRLCGILSLESGLWDVINRRIPTLKAVHYSDSGRLFHSYISIAKRVPGEGMLAGLLAVSADRNGTLAIVVDEDVDIYNEEEVLWAVATRVDFAEDIAVIPKCSSGSLNPRAYGEKSREKGLDKGDNMAKVIIDATKPATLPWPQRVTSPKDIWDNMRIQDYIKEL